MRLSASPRARRRWRGGRRSGNGALMNAEQLKKQIGQRLRLRPLARIVTGHDTVVEGLSSDGPRYVEKTTATDYDWLLISVASGKVTLRCEYTGHEVGIGADNVREYRT